MEWPILPLKIQILMPSEPIFFIILLVYLFGTIQTTWFVFNQFLLFMQWKCTWVHF